MDDLNLYEDLDEFHEQHEKKSKELQEAEEKYQQSLKTIEELKAENKTLKKNIQRIELGFQSLLDTARSEIKRKDKEIDCLRKEKDDICFRRKISTKQPAHVNNESNWVNNCSVNNPFKHNDVKGNEISLTESDLISAEVCEGVRQMAEKRNLNCANDETEDRSGLKKLRGSLNNHDDKQQQRFYKHHNDSQKTEQQYRRNGVHNRENDKNKVYEKDDGKNRSRDRDSKHKYDKLSKHSERNGRYDKELSRNRSRERDKLNYKPKNFKESISSKERHKTHASSKSASRSPSKSNKSERLHFKNEKNSVQIETEKPNKLFNKDLGEEAILITRTAYKNLETENLPKETEERVRNAIRNCANSYIQNEQITKQEKLKSCSVSSKDHLQNKFDNGFPKGPENNVQYESKDLEKDALSTPNRVAIFNEMFGKSPSLCGLIPISSASLNTFLSSTKEATAQFSQIEVISSATTSPANYTDIDSCTKTPINRTVEALTSSAGGTSCKTHANNELIRLDRRSKDELNECFAPNTNAQLNLKSIGCIGLTNNGEDDVDKKLDFIQIPGLDLYPKRKITKTEYNINAWISITENLERFKEETDITTLKLPKEKPRLDFKDEKPFKTTDLNKTKLKEKLDIENCDNVVKNQIFLITDETAKQCDFGSGMLNIYEKNCANSLVKSEGIAQDLKAPICRSNSSLDRRENTINKTSKENDAIMSNLRNDFTNEVVAIDAKQCGGLVALQNPYNFKENEQASSNSNKSKLEESCVTVESKVFDLNSENEIRNKNAHEVYIDGNKEDENVSQIEATCSHTTTDDADSFCKTKTNSIQHDTLKSHIDENSSEASNAKSSTADSVVVLSNKSNTVVPGRYSDNEILLEINENAEQPFLQRHELNPSLGRKENSIKISQELDKVIEDIELKGSRQANTKIEGQESYLNIKESNVSKDPSPTPQKGSQLTEVECPVSKEDQGTQSKIASKPESPSLSKENIPFNVKQENSLNSLEKYLKSDNSNIINSAEGTKTLENDKLDINAVEDKAIIISKNEHKVSKKNSKIIVESIEVLPSIKILQNENENFADATIAKTTSFLISEEAFDNEPNSKKNLEVVKASTQTLKKHEENLNFVTAQNDPFYLPEKGSKRKQEMHKKVKIIDLCSPIKTVSVEEQKILPKPKLGTESCVSVKSSIDDYNTQEKHSTAIESNDNCIPQAKTLQTESCPSDKSVENLRLGGDNHESSNVEQYGKNVLHEKSISKEMLPTNSQIIEEKISASTEPTISERSRKNNDITINTSCEEQKLLRKETDIKESHIINGSSGDVDNPLRGGKLTEVGSINLKSKQSGTLQTDGEYLGENESQKTVKKSNEHISKNVITEDEHIAPEVEQENLTDSIEILLPHVIQDGQNDSLDLDLAEEIKESGEENQTPSTNIMVTSDITNISQSEQQSLLSITRNVKSSLWDMKQKDNETNVEALINNVTKTETCSHAILSCQSTETSGKTLTAANYLEQNSKENSCNKKTDLKSTSRQDEENGAYSFTLAVNCKEICYSSTSKQAEVSSNSGKIKTEVTLVKPAHKLVDNSYNADTGTSAQLDPKVFKTWDGNQSFIRSEETSPTKIKHQESYETNETLYSEDSSLVNSCPKETLPKQANILSCNDTDLSKKDAEPCSNLSLDSTHAANSTKACVESTPKSIIKNQNDLENLDKFNKESPVDKKLLNTAQHATSKPEELEDDNIPAKLPSKTSSKSIKLPEHLRKEYEIKRVSQDTNMAHAVSLCEDEITVIMINAEERSKTLTVNHDENLQTTSTSFEVINKSLDNENEGTVIGFHKLTEQKPAVDELQNDANNENKSREMNYNFEGVEKPCDFANISHTLQKNPPLTMECTTFEAEIAKPECEAPPSYPLRAQEQEFGKTSEPYSINENSHLEKALEATDHKTETTGLVSNKQNDPIGLPPPSCTQQINKENEVPAPSGCLKAGNLSQGLVGTKRIIYLKKIVSKEINMDGQIVEVVKNIVDFDGSQTKAATISSEAQTAAPVGDSEQHEENIHQEQAASAESETDVLPPILAELFPNLPSISATLPTPSNFSGIFSKMPCSTATSEDESNKLKKKPLHMTAKRKEYILPAASVLCNVDNLENATKNNKKLHWELLDNKSEMTEIEDDVDIDTTDNEELQIQEHALENPSSLPKQKNLQKSSSSETDTQTEDEALLNCVQQKDKYKKPKQSKIKLKLPQTAKAAVVATGGVDDGQPLQEPSSLVSSKRPVGRPRKTDRKYESLDKPMTHKKRGRKPKKIDETNVAHNYKKESIELKTNTEKLKSLEPENVERKVEKLRTQSCFSKVLKCDGKYIENAKALSDCDRNTSDDLKNLSSSVEKLEICDEPCSSRDSFKQRKSFEAEMLDARKQDDFNILLAYHKQDFPKDGINTSTENNLAASNEQLWKKIGSKCTTIVDRDKKLAVSSASIEIQSDFVHKECIVDEKAQPDSAEPKITQDRPSPENYTKNRSCLEESIEEKGDKLAKSLSLAKLPFGKKLPSMSKKNKGKTIMSLEDIGTNARPPKVHLSSFRIPKIKNNPEDVTDNSWKLEKYVALENIKDKNQTQESIQQEKVTPEMKLKAKDSWQASKSIDVSSKENVHKEQSKSNSIDLALQKDVQLQAEKQIKENPKNLPKTDINYDTKTGRRKLFRADTYDRSDTDIGHRNTGRTETQSSKSSSKQDLNVIKTLKADLVEHRRKPVQVLSQIRKSTCDETKSTENCTKPLKKFVNLHRRILDSSSDEDGGNVAKKIKLSSNEVNRTSQVSQPETNPSSLPQDQTTATDLRKNETNIQVHTHDHINTDPRIHGKEETHTNKVQLPDTEENECNNQQPSKTVKSVKMLKKSLTASKTSLRQENIQQNSIYINHLGSEIDAQRSKNNDTEEEGKDSIHKIKSDTVLRAISTHQGRPNRHKKTTNQKFNSEDKYPSDTIQGKIVPQFKEDLKAGSDTIAELTQTNDSKVPKPSVSSDRNLNPGNNQKVQNDPNKFKQSLEDEEVSDIQPHNSSHMEAGSDPSAALTQPQDKGDRITENPIAVESSFVPAEKVKRRRRRVVKVISSSMDSSNNSTNASQDSFREPSPFASPLFNHPIFNNEVSTQSTEFAMTLPQTPNQSDDVELGDIDSKLNELFKSPTHTTDNIDRKLSAVASSDASVLPPLLNGTQPYTTKEDTLDVSSSLNNSQLNNSSVPLNETPTSHNSTEVKYLKMGSSQYRIEKVSDNVVNLFITRKRKRKSKH